jgi:serine protease Do
MKIIVLITATFLSFNFCLAQRSEGYADLVERVKPSIVIVGATDRSGRLVTRGTGFCVGPGIFITNYHVIKDAYGVVIRTVDNKTHRVTIGSSNETADIALLNTEGDLGVKPLKLTTRLPKVGERILVVGNPLGGH